MVLEGWDFATLMAMPARESQFWIDATARLLADRAEAARRAAGK